MCLQVRVLHLPIELFYKQKAPSEVSISVWSSDVCSSDLPHQHHPGRRQRHRGGAHPGAALEQHLPGQRQHRHAELGERKSVVEGKTVSARVDLGGGRLLKTTTGQTSTHHIPPLADDSH